MIAAIFFVLAVLAISLGILRMSQSSAVGVYVFLTPWVGLTATIGIDLRIGQVFFLPLIWAYFFSLAKNYTPGNIGGRSQIGALVIFSIIVTLVWSPFLPADVVEGGWLRQPVPRSMGQIVMFLILIAPVIVIPAFLKTWGEVAKVLRYAFYSIIVLAVTGILQLVVWEVTGVDILPVGIVNQYLGGRVEDTRFGGEYGVSNFYISRINSFAGEPKGLGSTMAIGMLGIQFVLMYVKERAVLQACFISWALCAVALFLTLSTTGYLLWALGTVLMIALLGGRILVSVKGAGMATIGLAAILPITIVTIAEASGIPVVELIYDRTLGRMFYDMDASGIQEDFNQAIILFLTENPSFIFFGTGLGNVHLFADPYLSEQHASYASGTAFVAKSYYLRLLSETGVVSLLLFVSWLLVVSRWLGRSVGRSQHRFLSDLLRVAVLVFGGCCLVSGYIAPQFFNLMGVLLAAGRILGSNYPMR